MFDRTPSRVHRAPRPSPSGAAGQARASGRASRPRVQRAALPRPGARRLGARRRPDPRLARLRGHVSQRRLLPRHRRGVPRGLRSLHVHRDDQRGDERDRHVPDGRT